MKKCGSIVLLGPPNAGKSTLLNAILQTKLAIVCHKRQTTRLPLAGIHMHGETQMVFFDTPGIFDPKSPLERRMVSAAWKSVSQVDEVVLLVDSCHAGTTEEIQRIFKRLSQLEKKVILVLNKVDRVPKESLLKKAQFYMETGIVKDVFMISALKKKGLESFLKHLEALMPLGEWMYPEDQLSDRSQQTLMAELTREKILHHIHDEIPYGLTVLPEIFEVLPQSIRIVQTIVTQNSGHRPILIGKGGERLKIIGQEARLAMERSLGCKVHLILHVRVDEKWQEKDQYYREIGFDCD